MNYVRFRGRTEKGGGGMESIRDIHGRWRIAIICSFLVLVPASVAVTSDATSDRDPWVDGKSVSPDKAPVLNGEFVHNVGSLQMNVTNWGFFGSLPKSRYAMADVPTMTDFESNSIFRRTPVLHRTGGPGRLWGRRADGGRGLSRSGQRHPPEQTRTCPD